MATEWSMCNLRHRTTRPACTLPNILPSVSVFQTGCLSAKELPHPWAFTSPSVYQCVSALFSGMVFLSVLLSALALTSPTVSSIVSASVSARVSATVSTTASAYLSTCVQQSFSALPSYNVLASGGLVLCILHRPIVENYVSLCFR